MGMDDMMKSFSLGDRFFLSMTSESQFHIISVNESMTPALLRILPTYPFLVPDAHLPSVSSKTCQMFSYMVYLDSSFLTLVLRSQFFPSTPWNSTIPQRRSGKILWLCRMAPFHLKLWSSWTSSCWNNRPIPASWNYNLKCYFWIAPVGDYEDFMALWPNPKALAAVLSHRTNVTRSSASASHVTVLAPGGTAYQLPRSILKTGERWRLLRLVISRCKIEPEFIPNGSETWTLNLHCWFPFCRFILVQWNSSSAIFSRSHVPNDDMILMLAVTPSPFVMNWFSYQSLS